VKKILVPTDFTSTAENAVEAARLLAKKNKAEILFLNVIEIDSGESLNTTGGASSGASFADGIIIQESIRRSEDEMMRLTDVSKFQGIKASYEIRLGNPFDHIFSAIENNDIDFIVMGTEGSSGLTEILVGSNTEKVVRKAKCPVLTIKESLNENNLKSIVYATNFGSNEGDVVSAIKDVQADFDSSIRLVWVNTPNDFKSDATTRPLLEKFVADHGLKNCTTHVYSDISAEDGIRNFAGYINSGLIVMGTNSYTGLGRLILLTVSMKE